MVKHFAGGWNLKPKMLQYSLIQFTDSNLIETHLCSLSCVQLFAVPWTIARQAPLSMEFYRQEYLSGVPLPTPRDHPDPGIKSTCLASAALAGGFFTSRATWEAYKHIGVIHNPAL